MHVSHRWKGVWPEGVECRLHPSVFQALHLSNLPKPPQPRLHPSINQGELLNDLTASSH